MTEEELRGLLREMADEPVPADSLARVRGRLAERMEKRARWSGLPWVLAGAVLCSAAFLAVHTAPVEKPKAVTVITRLPDRTQMEPQRAEQSEPVHPKVRRAVRRLRPVREPQPPGITIRIDTPDPDVVIILSGQ